MKGMSRLTGLAITDGAPGRLHLRQSINDILTTPVGSRLCRRLYGCLIAFLIDAPANENTRMKLMSAAATALIRWEPRIRISQVIVSQDADTPAQWIINVLGSELLSNSQTQPFNETVFVGAAA